MFIRVYSSERLCFIFEIILRRRTYYDDDHGMFSRTDFTKNKFMKNGKYTRIFIRLSNEYSTKNVSSVKYTTFCEH